MGICLDTEPRPSSHSAFEERSSGGGEEDEGEDEDEEEEEESEPRFLGRGPRPGLQTGIKFEPPAVPVVFVLGGPGSGKVTHCDTLATEKRGFVHINMTDLLQQFAVGNDLSDFNQLPSAAVTEVLMLEMKMAHTAKMYLVSGFPRSMRDMAEYSDKIQVLSGAVLISWRQKVLARQVEYGAKLGHVVLSLATMELRNFYRSVMPVADYLDQRGQLSVVDGERNPEEVYRDFRETVQQLLSPTQVHIMAPKTQVTSMAVIETPPAAASPIIPTRQPIHPRPIRPAIPVAPAVAMSNSMEEIFPPAIFIIGGPGSNKTSLCQRALRRHPDWGLVSLGRQLRAAAGAGGGGVSGKGSVQQQAALRQSIAAGEMASQSVVLALLAEQMSVQSGARGLLIAGFPRDLQQLRAFESKYGQRPAAILLDCSKLQLGRGRLDDSVAAFRRRLELFRELTLPLLKLLDQQGRLSIVDGDTDSTAVLEDFCSVLVGIMARAEAGESSGGPPGAALGTGSEFLPATAGQHHQALLHELEESADPITATTQTRPASDIPSTFRNGGLLVARPPSRDTIREMYAELEGYSAS